MLSFGGEKKKPRHGKEECRDDAAAEYQFHLCPSFVSNVMFIQNTLERSGPIITERERVASIVRKC
ncbi:hypothetical protein SDC9_191545 [bioreactor metagenome]|uniref:Uncharacterized protein n=1 Tax=bioreactor metagenome TaxID=1076179 RepID=A0A645I6G0_9ZZZZ